MILLKSKESAYFRSQVFATIKQTNFNKIVNPVFGESGKGLNSILEKQTEKLIKNVAN